MMKRDRCGECRAGHSLAEGASPRPCSRDAETPSLVDKESSQERHCGSHTESNGQPRLNVPEQFTR